MIIRRLYITLTTNLYNKVHSIRQCTSACLQITLARGGELPGTDGAGAEICICQRIPEVNFVQHSKASTGRECSQSVRVFRALRLDFSHRHSSRVVFGFILLMWKLEGNGKTLNAWQKLLIEADSHPSARSHNPVYVWSIFLRSMARF